jgi:hypothetical protein
MTPVVGVDPGAGGACVVLDGRQVVDWLVWWRRSSYTVAVSPAHGEQRVDRLSETVARWRDCITVAPCGYTLAVEGLFIVGAKGNGRSMLSLAESAGMLRGVLEQRAVGVTHRPPAKDWRPEILGLRARTPAEVCEDHARKVAPVRWQWVHDVPRHKGARGALAEAACIAEWARMRRGVGA